eukprot:scaffold6942_cov72-Phaeocystis_antarctica.AAC.14
MRKLTRKLTRKLVDDVTADSKLHQHAKREVHVIDAAKGARNDCVNSTKAPAGRAGHAVLYGALCIDLVPPATRHKQHIARFERHARKGNRAVALTACRLLNALVGTDAARFVLQRVGGVRHRPSASPGHAEVDVIKGVTLQLR